MTHREEASEEKLRSSALESIRDSEEGLASGKYQKFVLALLASEYVGLGFLSDTIQEAKGYFKKAAQCDQEFFHIAWENRDKREKVPGDVDGSFAGAVGAIDGMHSAMAAGEWEIAKDIASHSGFENDWAHGKDAISYEGALRNLLLHNDPSGFSAVRSQKRHAIGYSDLAAIFLIAAMSPEKARQQLEEFARTKARSIKGSSTFTLAVYAIREWLATRVHH